MNFLNKLHNSRNVALQMIESRGFNAEKYTNFTIKELDIMKQNTTNKLTIEDSPLDIAVSNTDNGKNLYIKYLLGTKPRLNNILSFVNEFSENMLIFGDDNKMSTNNMKLLWKIYLNKCKMPEIMFKREIIDIMKLKCNMTGNMFVGVRWNMCSVDFNYFKEFWSSKITHNIEIDDSYEISEIHDLFGQWIVKTKNKPHVFSEEDVLYIIKFICNDIKIVNDKNVENVVCKMWNKKESLFDILPKMLKNKELHYDITIVNAYKEYVKYLGDQDTNIVSKRYFERYIQKIVPPQYIDSVNNLIRKEFWI